MKYIIIKGDENGVMSMFHALEKTHAKSILYKHTNHNNERSFDLFILTYPDHSTTQILKNLVDTQSRFLDKLVLEGNIVQHKDFDARTYFCDVTSNNVDILKKSIEEYKEWFKTYE